MSGGSKGAINPRAPSSTAAAASHSGRKSPFHQSPSIFEWRL